jgi:hypothetical protein
LGFSVPYGLARAAAAAVAEPNSPMNLRKSMAGPLKSAANNLLSCFHSSLALPQACGGGTIFRSDHPILKIVNERLNDDGLLLVFSKT